MICRVTLEAIPRKRYNGVPGIGCSTAVVFETVARIHEVKHFVRFLQACYVQCQDAHVRGNAGRECKEMNQESRVNAYQEAQEQGQTDLTRNREPSDFYETLELFQTTPTCKGYVEATDTAD